MPKGNGDFHRFTGGVGQKLRVIKLPVRKKNTLQPGIKWKDRMRFFLFSVPAGFLKVRP
jgi:hypothetical protein